ncbi:hypothetical protein [Paenibacillus odorifer]|uniref:Uncharacterized protein n=1 Tax=Paenibacillus odorifer TaxID=189426 RepID=A0AAD0P5M4_9BACL|nr:hypothetical protein [Paenibacillus odorifer]AWV35175.1 hypothetical protein CD191_22460 [Paenibacillus odorifer]
MPQGTGLGIMNTILELQSFYRENLTNRKLMTTRKIRSVMYLSLLLVILGVISCVISTVISIDFWSFLGILFFVLSISIFLFALRSSKKHVLLTLPEYSPLVKDRLMSFEEEIFLAYRIDRFEQELIEKHIKPTYIQSLIEHLDSKSETIKSNKWFPISVSVVVFFPLWSEYVGKQISIDSFNLIPMSIIGLFIVLFAIGFNSFLKGMLWSEALHYDQLTRILKIVLSSEVYLNSQVEN